MPDKIRVVFMGTPEFAVPILQGLLAEHEVLAVVTQPDRPAGRGRALKPPPVKALALACGLPVFQPAGLRNDPSLLACLRELAPQVVVVAAFGMLLPPEFLALPSKGCLNVHASLLPRHRGAAPIPAAILAGDRETGVTIMLMDEGLDTGPILSQAHCAIRDDDTASTLSERLAQLGRDLLLETLPKWVTGEIVPRPQDEEAATYAPPLRVADAEILWTRPAERLAREVRAFNPWPGSYTFWQGQRLKVLRARPAKGDVDGVPGQVVLLGGRLGVITGDGILVLEEVQPAGKRPMAAEAFLRGQRGLVGSTLGAC